MSRDEILSVYEQGPEAVVTLIQALYAQTQQLGERVKALEEMVATNSRNSRLPPSSDRNPAPKPKSLRGPSGKKPGKDIQVRRCCGLSNRSRH